MVQVTCARCDAKSYVSWTATRRPGKLKLRLSKIWRSFSQSDCESVRKLKAVRAVMAT